MSRNQSGLYYIALAVSAVMLAVNGYLLASIWNISNGCYPVYPGAACLFSVPYLLGLTMNVLSVTILGTSILTCITVLNHKILKPPS